MVILPPILSIFLPKFISMEYAVLIVYYVPRRIIRVITRRPTMLAGDRSRGAISPSALAPYCQSLVHLNCACSITICYYYTRSIKSKWPELVAKYKVRWTRIMMNSRLDSSVRIKTRIHTEVT